MGEGMLCAAVWEEDENQSVGGKGWGGGGGLLLAMKLYLWASALLFRVGR